MPTRTLVLAVLALAAAVMPACSSTGIALRENLLGQAKRDQLVNRVEDARDAQNDAREQFASALEEFIAVTGVSADASVADLESRYKRLKAEFDRSEARASKVSDRIQSVERVANALFREWESELDQYQSQQLRRASEDQLNDTRAQYQRLIDVMKQAERKMPPVLVAFRDQVLFLKHNLNARAIASLQGAAAEVQADVASLIRDMETSIAEANAFIEQMQPPK